MFAILIKEYKAYGCPHCSYENENDFIPEEQEGTCSFKMIECGYCKEKFFIRSEYDTPNNDIRGYLEEQGAKFVSHPRKLISQK